MKSSAILLVLQLPESESCYETVRLESHRVLLAAAARATEMSKWELGGGNSCLTQVSTIFSLGKAGTEKGGWQPRCCLFTKEVPLPKCHYFTMIKCSLPKFSCKPWVSWCMGVDHRQTLQVSWAKIFKVIGSSEQLQSEGKNFWGQLWNISTEKPLWWLWWRGCGYELFPLPLSSAL